MSDVTRLLLRLRAQETQRAAELAKTPRAKQMLQSLAATYQELAARYDERKEREDDMTPNT